MFLLSHSLLTMSMLQDFTPLIRLGAFHELHAFYACHVIAGLDGSPLGALGSDTGTPHSYFHIHWPQTVSLLIVTKLLFEKHSVLNDGNWVVVIVLNHFIVFELDASWTQALSTNICRRKVIFLDVSSVKNKRGLGELQFIQTCGACGSTCQ